MNDTSIVSWGPAFRPRPAAIIPLAAVVFAILFAGCGRGTAPASVEGVVTLDGKPLAGATVLFRPSLGRPSAGTTDAAGRYRLRYTSEREGAVPGEHVVSISMLGEDSGGDDVASGRAEPIPARYNTQTELKATVNTSSTTVDFGLQSK
jgi:hypothetical protein